MKRLLPLLLFLALPVVCHAAPAPASIALTAVNTTAQEGGLAAFLAVTQDQAGKRLSDVTLQPLMDGRPWCAPVTTNAYGLVRFVLPMPLTGMHSIQMQAGKLVSAPAAIQVKPRVFHIITDPNHLVGMDLETWFGPGYAKWGHQEATPLLGEYSSLDTRVLRQQTLWMNQLGINFVQLDWSNNLNGPWATPVAREMRDSTNLLCNLYLTMKQHPAIVLLVGPDNNRWGTPNFMKEINYIYKHYLQNPRYRKLFLTYLGKPLLDVYMGGPTTRKPPSWTDSRFTIRYVNAWLESTHVAKYGYWSWYDRVPQPTYFHGRVEALTTVFGYPGNISDPATGNYETTDAGGKDYGVTFRMQWRKALRYKPHFLFICQWNEFEPPDQWSQNMSNDIEPTLHRGFGRRGTGGWGFEYFDLCRRQIRRYQQALGNLREIRRFDRTSSP